MFTFLILFLLFGVVSVFLYFTLFIFANAFIKLTNRQRLSSDKKRRLSKIFLISSFIIVGVMSFILLLISPSKNYKTAFIQKEKDHFVLTVRGKRLNMIHDPLSLFLRKTYEDSAKYIIPRRQGIIKGEEITFSLVIINLLDQ